MTVWIGVVMVVPDRLAYAQQPLDLAAPKTKPTLARNKPVSPNVTINLVNLLVAQGVLTEQQAAALIKQAENEAFVAREAVKGASEKATAAEKTATDAAKAVSPPGTKRVTYVPEIVKRELREEIRQEVMGKAKKEGWANPDIVPEWVNRIRFYGDVRVRYEQNRFPTGNNTTGLLPNFNAVNTGNPFDTLSGGLLPIRDTDEDRNRFRLKARLGAEIDLFDGWSSGIRMAVGDSSSPVSTNATLGGGGGNFSKYPVWLDRAYIRYQTVNEHFTLSVGRFNNPFFAPTDLVWYDELGFDGAAAQVKYEAAPGFVPFAVAGAFPLYNTLVNFPNNGRLDQGPDLQGTNLPSSDKYLFGGQIGFDWKITPDVQLKVGAAYYDFHNVEGRVSDPCATATSADTCNTDALRPSFAQFGNTYIPLRNNITTAAFQGQYYGLATPFRVVELTGRLDLAYFNPVHLLVDGTYVRNIAFDWNTLNQIAFNNLITTSAGTQVFVGGNTGAMGRVLVGHPKLQQAWDWNAYVAYKYLESDATVDAFTDPDFGLGGTNLQGYIIGANLGINKYVWSSLKWMSATSIAGPRFAVDVLQIDLNARF